MVGPWRLERQTSTVSRKSSKLTIYIYYLHIAAMPRGVHLESKLPSWSKPVIRTWTPRAANINCVPSYKWEDGRHSRLVQPRSSPSRFEMQRTSLSTLLYRGNADRAALRAGGAQVALVAGSWTCGARAAWPRATGQPSRGRKMLAVHNRRCHEINCVRDFRVGRAQGGGQLHQARHSV
jgi:hypothetical protein